MTPQFRASVLAAVLAVVALSGCVQMPTETQSVVDQRPQISFHLKNDAQGAARVFVDRLDMGEVGDYAAGKGALRVLPGTHIVEVRLGAEPLLNERVYLADGVSRAFRLN